MKVSLKLVAGAAIAASIGVMALPAEAAVVTFDDAAGNAIVDTSQSQFSDQGLTFTNNSGPTYVWDGSSPNSNGTNNLIQGYGLGDSVTITKTGGGSFKLNNLDLAISWYSPNSTDSVNVNGTPLNITNVLTNYTLNLTGPSVTISGLSSGSSYWTADNIQFNAVPEPATWAMMLVGLGGLGVALRTQRRKQAFAAA